MKITFIGRGGAFAPLSIGNSNMMFTSDNGRRLMVDFGSTAPYIYRDEMGMDFKDIDGVYITHLHADHISGLEMLAFSRYFMPKKDESGQFVRPKLYAVRGLMKDLWEHCLRGGLESLQGKIMSLTDYFDCKPVSENKHFIWEGYEFTPVQTVHVRSGYIIKHSYGLTVRKVPLKKPLGLGFIDMESPPAFKFDAYITSDTQFDMGLMDYYYTSRTIFHDCETYPQKSYVHPHYSDLTTLPKDVKNRMWLYHYGQKIDTFKEDGFAGFVEKGQEFTI